MDCRTSTSPRSCRRWRRTIANGRVIVAHLGSGASLCALSQGRSVDSTLGFTALDGLCMGTRPGAVDPGVILHLFQTLGLSAKEVETILYKRSGLIAISGISNDMRDLLGSDRACRGPRGRLLRLSRHERDWRPRGGPWRPRRRWCSPPASARTPPRFASGSAGRRRGSASTSIQGRMSGTIRVSRTQRSRVSAWVVPTNEELMIAQHTAALLGLSGRRA